jgi:hypothetical protein
VFVEMWRSQTRTARPKAGERASCPLPQAALILSAKMCRFEYNSYQKKLGGGPELIVARRGEGPSPEKKERVQCLDSAPKVSSARNSRGCRLEQFVEMLGQTPTVSRKLLPQSGWPTTYRSSHRTVLPSQIVPEQ